MDAMRSSGRAEGFTLVELLVAITVFAVLSGMAYRATRSRKGAMPPSRSPKSVLRTARAAGFTLVELLVAITVFAVLSGMAYRALSVVLESRGHIERENRKWREVALFLARLEQDVATAVPRPVRDAGDVVAPAVAGTPVPARAQDGVLVLTRTAFAATPGAAESPRRLGYRLRGATVELLAWTVLDQGPRTEPTVVAALRDVKQMEVRFLDRRGQWHLQWPPAGASAPQKAIPAGVEVAVTLATGERVVRLMPTGTRQPQL
jgi:general secretion pathway protein J